LWYDCLQEEGRIQSKASSSREEHVALTAKSKKGKRFPYQKNPFVQMEKSKASFKGKDFDITKVRCFHYQKRGHFRKDCPQLRKGRKGKFHAIAVAEEEEEGSSGRKSIRTSNNQERPKGFYLVLALTGSLKNNAKSWLVDSGASRHMTGNKNFLENLKELKVTSKVELGDDSNHEIKGIGSVSFHLDFGDTLHFEDVLFVPGLTKNLISVGVIEEKGHRVVFMEKKALLWFGASNLNSTITIGVKQGGLYKVPVLIQEPGIGGLTIFTSKLFQVCRK